MEFAGIKKTLTSDDYIAKANEYDLGKLKEEFQVSCFSETELKMYNHICGFQKVCKEKYSLNKVYELLSLAKCINMNQCEADSFIEWIEKVEVNDLQNVHRAEAILKGMRSKKQRNHLVSYEELDYAIVNEDIKLLNEIFMTSAPFKITEFNFRRIDKNRFAERYFDALKNTYGYVSFGSVAQAQ
ncbi:hypothetical protein SAMN04487895_10336 [Paenibacillus sophorae]|uniref:Uncharacterized protein n=1 Tax=Paenibacillus sophorae TaxID=1333845 RepID=A0A1H8JIH0_9BACL|nr:hypothetical protein [Paenibacillus sophorae]QWU13373.1 hypothetical protein KP014_15335 [Paenibacillus sophorae]SEN80482.1 hypothetical protein SAMN04487895_10336 [Paenibacillus sophorae]